jgi:hypothetical protein
MTQPVTWETEQLISEDGRFRIVRDANDDLYYLTDLAHPEFTWPCGADLENARNLATRLSAYPKPAEEVKLPQGWKQQVSITDNDNTYRVLKQPDGQYHAVAILAEEVTRHVGTAGTLTGALESCSRDSLLTDDEHVPRYRWQRRNRLESVDGSYTLAPNMAGDAYLLTQYDIAGIAVIHADDLEEAMDRANDVIAREPAPKPREPRRAKPARPAKKSRRTKAKPAKKARRTKR